MPLSGIQQAGGSARQFTGVDADLMHYLRRQWEQDRDVDIIVLPTTREEESLIRQRLDLYAGGGTGFDCAKLISAVLQGICGIDEQTMWPGKLYDIARRAKLECLQATSR